MIFYLHGFASGPESTKGRLLAERFASQGVALERPDLTPGPDGFETSTMSAMLALVRGLLNRAPGPHTLIGSSMGAYLAALLAEQDPRIERLILLAPAFRMAKRWQARMSPDEVARLRSEGSLEMFHYGSRTRRRIGRQFFEDLARHPDFPRVTVPTLCIAGLRDDVVPLDDVEKFVASTPSARLVVVDDSHELVASIDRIWDEVSAFLG